MHLLLEHRWGVGSTYTQLSIRLYFVRFLYLFYNELLPLSEY